MTRIYVSILLDAEPGQVWEVVAPVERHVDWMADAVAIRFEGTQRQGVGTALLRQARACSPAELRLFTFQRNDKARAFYEKHGFTVVALGVSPAPELEPDVEYRWVA